MTIKTKTTIKKALAITGLGLLLAGALGSVAFLGYELAHKPTKANVMAKAESETLTNLGGSTWLLNDTINAPSVQLSTPTFDMRITFSSNSNELNEFFLTYTYYGITLQYSNNDTTITAYNWVNPNAGSGDTLFKSFALTDWTNTAYQTIEINGGADSTNSDLINWLYENATLQSVSGGDEEPTPTPQTYDFTFNASPNMNAPLGFNVESIILPQPSNQESVPFFIDYDMPYFTSNGKRFNQIRIFYNIGRDIGYLDKNGSYVMNTTANTCMATNMIFKDTATNSAVSVYTRVQTSMQDSEGAVYPWTNSWKWKSNNYRYLTFEEMPSTTQIDQLSNLNTGYDTIYQNATTEIGLGGAFTILGSAFSAWSNIFSIQVIPGISIGLLLFMPLIVGIIILVIWIIKR